MQSIPLPPPYKGQRDDLPLAVLESPYAEVVENFNLDTGIAKLRYGDRIWSYGGSDTEIILTLDSYGAASAEKMFSVYDAGGALKWLDVTTEGVQTLVHSLGAGGDDEIVTLFFNNYLFYFGEAALLPATSGPQYYNGTAWGAAAYTWPGGFTQPFGGGVYKNRAYILHRQAARYVYSDINAISGATVEVDLSQIISQRAYLYGIRAVALSEGIQQETVCAFIFSSGEVLVYQGSFPNSTSWGLVGRFVIGQPAYYNSLVDARGDTFIITNSALVSLRSLFMQGGEVATRQGLTAPIANRWRQIIEKQPSGFKIYIRGEYDHINDRLIISLPNYVDRDGVNDYTEAMRLIYSFKTGSWYEHRMAVEDQGFLVTAMTYFNDAIYFGGVSRNVKQAEGKGDYRYSSTNLFMDDSGNGSPDTSIDYTLRTTPLPIGKFAVNQIQGVELISKTDLYAETNYKLIGNFGQEETASQKLPDQGGGLAKPVVNIGIESDYVQLDISGSTTSSTAVGFEIYALNVWNEPSEGPR